MIMLPWDWEDYLSSSNQKIYWLSSRTMTSIMTLLRLGRIKIILGLVRALSYLRMNKSVRELSSRDRVKILLTDGSISILSPMQIISTLIKSKCKELYSSNFSQQTRRTVRLSKYLTESNIERVMKLRGLPYSITIDQIQEFFADFGVTKSDVVIEENNGKKTGFGLVFFKDQETA